MSIADRDLPEPACRMIRDIPCYAPELAHENDSYPQEAFAKLVRIEEQHFWFRTRNVVIRAYIDRFLAKRAAPADFLELGCGTGFVLQMLRALPYLRVAGADLHLAGLAWARTRVSDVELMQVDATHLPYEDRFDAIGLFDVLEHIEDDSGALAAIHHALRADGLVFLTVPQYPRLWSSRDVMAGHKRRYTRRPLASTLEKNGFIVETMGSFCCTLFPLLVLMRLLSQRNKEATIDEIESAEFAPPALINNILRGLTRIDEWWVRRGFSLPFGGSLITVARKRTL